MENLLVSMDRNIASHYPEEFLKCKISRQVFRDPVVAADGISYEKKYLAFWINLRKVKQADGTIVFPSPTTRELLPTVVYSNSNLSEAISSSPYKFGAFSKQMDPQEERMDIEK